MAAWTYELDCESLTTGSPLGGQDSWNVTSSDNTDVVTSPVNSGSKAIEVDNNTGNTGMNRTISTVSDDGSTLYISLRGASGSSNSNMVFITRDGSNKRTLYLLIGKGSATGKIQTLSSGATWRDIVSGFSADTWYRVGVEFNFTANQYRTNLNGGSFSSWYGFLDGSVSNIVRLDLQGNGTVPNTQYYFDDISASYDTGGGGVVTPQFIGFGGI